MLAIAEAAHRCADLLDADESSLAWEDAA